MLRQQGPFLQVVLNCTVLPLALCVINSTVYLTLRTDCTPVFILHRSFLPALLFHCDRPDRLNMLSTSRTYSPNGPTCPSDLGPPASRRSGHRGDQAARIATRCHAAPTAEGSNPAEQFRISRVIAD